jgi:APA family basic amino acid/polyamine antiporter
MLLIPAHAPAPSQPVTAAGFLALAAVYQLIRGAYNGWHAPVYFSEESLAPDRSLPRALFFGIAFTAAIYLFVNVALLHALGPAEIATRPLPFVIVLDRIAGHAASVVFAIGALITVASCANANVMIAPRILFALSRDRLLPSALLAVNKGGSPYIAFLLTAVFSIALSTTGGFRMVFGMIATLVTLGSILTEISLFALRAREPETPRPYRAVLYPWLPALVIAMDVVLLAMFAHADLRGAVFAAALCLLCVPFALVARHAWAK